MLCIAFEKLRSIAPAAKICLIFTRHQVEHKQGVNFAEDIQFNVAVTRSGLA